MAIISLFVIVNNKKYRLVLVGNTMEQILLMDKQSWLFVCVCVGLFLLINTCFNNSAPQRAILENVRFVQIPVRILCCFYLYIYLSLP
jgi:hypothetical protein